MVSTVLVPWSLTWSESVPCWASSLVWDPVCSDPARSSSAVVEVSLMAADWWLLEQVVGGPDHLVRVAYPI
jgi:hypothetical protein